MVWFLVNLIYVYLIFSLSIGIPNFFWENPRFHNWRITPYQWHFTQLLLTGSQGWTEAWNHGSILRNHPQNGRRIQVSEIWFHWAPDVLYMYYMQLWLIICMWDRWYLPRDIYWDWFHQQYVSMMCLIWVSLLTGCMNLYVRPNVHGWKRTHMFETLGLRDALSSTNPTRNGVAFEPCWITGSREVNLLPNRKLFWFNPQFSPSFLVCVPSVPG